MRVLVLESDAGIAAGYERALTDAGHEVVHCHEPGAPVFPCAGVPDPDGCPLHGGRVDVALLVRDPIVERPRAREAGVACALRARVPVLEPDRGSPHDPYVGFVDRFDGDVVTALSAATASASRGHAEAVLRHLRAAASAQGIDGSGLAVTAWRRGAALRVEVTLPADADPVLRGAASSWSITAARAYDPVVETIDIVLRSA